MSNASHIIRKAYKLVLVLPVSTSTQKLLHLGFYNSFDELLEAHHMNQLLHLSSTSTSRTILSQLGLRSPLQHPQADATQLSHKIHQFIDVAPLLRNMHPTHHQDRGNARAQAIFKRHGENSTTVYTDAASYPGRRAKTAVVPTPQALLKSASIPTTHALQSEEVAIALAIAQTTAEIIITECQQACRTFSTGFVSPHPSHTNSAAAFSKTPRKDYLGSRPCRRARQRSCPSAYARSATPG